MSGAILMATLALVCHACASSALAPPAATTAEVASPRALPPTVEELKNATYAALGEQLAGDARVRPLDGRAARRCVPLRG